ncbi:hypothetical protein F320042A7_23030 [Blautia producta]
MNRILIIDDDRELCVLMKKCVEQEHLSAVTANCGAEGLRLFDENKNSSILSLVILDVMMPDIDGFQVLKKIRETSNVPVLMLTAKSGEEDKVSGLRLGADDYLTKPFSISELMARVNSLIRRYTTFNNTAFTANEECITLQGMVIDKANRMVSIDDIPIELTGKEFDLSPFWHLIRDGFLLKNRYIHKYGNRNMPLMITILCLLSVNCVKRSSQTRNGLFTF